MPFVLKEFKGILEKKIQLFLLQDLGFSPKMSQKILARKRVFDEFDVPFELNGIIKTNKIYIALFEGQTRGLKPIFQNQDFAVFDKPSGIKVHPVGKHTKYSLLDEIRYLFGDNANLVHRIDAETSGLVLVSKNKIDERALKLMFEEKKYKKKYLALVCGELKKACEISKPLKKEGKNIGLKMQVHEKDKDAKNAEEDEENIKGIKDAFTKVKPLKYSKKKDLSLVELELFTGRQHQLRVHLAYIKHKIYGDPIYAIEEKYALKYLENQLSQNERIKTSGSFRLWLQANYLEFSYKGLKYIFYSKQNEIKDFVTFD